jgi:hypothetical protein
VARNTYKYNQAQLTHRTTLQITRKMSAFLERLSELTKAQEGKYLDRSQIIRGLVEALMALEGQVDWHGIKDEDELVHRLVRAFSKK